jgi:hypothetical protein
MGKRRSPLGIRGRNTADGKGIDKKAAAEIDKELRKKYGL